jgi:hypothetical protein
MTPAGSPCCTITAHRKPDTSAATWQSGEHTIARAAGMLVRSNRAHAGEFGCVRPTKYDRLIECGAPGW